MEENQAQWQPQPQKPEEQRPGGWFRRAAQQPPGPLDGAKRAAVFIFLPILVLCMVYTTFFKQDVPKTQNKNGAPSIVPTNPSLIDDQQRELNQQLRDADRAAREAELAKRRAQMVINSGGDLQQDNQAKPPDPTQALRQQLLQERLRREAQAPFASSVAFAGKAPGSSRTKEEEPAATISAHPAPKEVIGSQQQDQPQEAVEAKLPERPKSCGYDPDAVPDGMHCLEDGTVIESVLVNRLDGTFSGPIIAQVSEEVYDLKRPALLIPRGARLLGEVKPVGSLDQERLAVFFHRISFQDPGIRAISLDKFQGLNQIGETGLKDKVNRHWLSIFGTSLAIGAIGGLAQIGSYGGGGYSPWYGFRIGVSERMAESAYQVLNRMLNRMPTVTILEGNRIRIYIAGDLVVPAYGSERVPVGM